MLTVAAIAAAVKGAVGKELSGNVLKAGGRQLRDLVSGPEKEQAFQRCLQAGVKAVVEAAVVEEPGEEHSLEEIFTQFFSDPMVGVEIAKLLRGGDMDMAQLTDLFADAGYDAKTLPGIDLAAGVKAFAEAFNDCQSTETLLHGQLIFGTLKRVEARVNDIAEMVEKGVYRGQATDDPVRALAIYRRVLMSECSSLPLRGIDVGASDASRNQNPMDLAQVYVDLDTTTQVPVKRGKKTQRSAREEELREQRPLSALEAAVQSKHMVLLGDPGSGKSTFLRHLSLCLAAHAVDPDGNWLDRLPGWPKKEAELVPVFVTLRDFAAQLPAEMEPDNLCYLWDFIAGRLAVQNLSFVTDPLLRALDDGKAIVLLDGLDEIPTDAQREHVRDAVQAFVRRHPNCRTLVTCRTLSYQDAAWQLDGFDSYELADWSEEKIDAFIAAWYEEARLGNVGREDAEAAARRLQIAIRRPDMWRLAPNPLLMTVMALVHTHKGRLPDARALLYEEIIDILLWRWEDVKLKSGEDARSLRRLLHDAGRAEVDLKTVLRQLAFEAHAGSQPADGDELADIGESQLMSALAGLHPHGSKVWAQEIVDTIKLRAGLLIERAPGVYTFPHRTFQEYLAGTHLAAQTDFVNRAVELAAEGAFWREVILLAVGRIVYVEERTDPVVVLLNELCPSRRKNTKLGWRNAWLAGDVICEAGSARIETNETGKDLGKRVRERLVALLEKGALSPRERVAAGNTLSRLGDPRFDPEHWFLPNSKDGMLGFIKVPAGPFWMGSDKEQDEDAEDNECPRHPVDLPTFYVSRYPVTVAQYGAFIEESGRESPYAKTSADRSNHPVIYVTWHDAMAYCDWLNDKLVAYAASVSANDESAEMWHGLASGKLRVVLPSEAEWEKAARGAEDRRIYPWGDTFDSNRASGELNIGAASAAGCFPTGRSPYGVEDMSGNVWEWTRSLWGKDFEKPQYGYPYRGEDGRERLDAPDDVLRVLRGGAFYITASYLRCSFRYWYDPYFGDYYIGFRIVVSPVGC